MPVIEAIKKAAKSAGFDLRSQFDLRSTVLGNSLSEAIREEIAESDCVLADVTSLSENIASEIGYAEGVGIPVLLIADQSRQKGTGETSSSIWTDYPVLFYEATPPGFRSLSEKVGSILEDFRKSPRKKLVPKDKGPTFFVDWDRLERREAENLCRELMMQMGFRGLDWIKHSPEIDLMAELPKKDPDGFEYREFWLVSMGGNAPVEMVFEMALHDSEMFWDRFIRRSDLREHFVVDKVNIPLTLLLISFDENPRLARHMRDSEFVKMPRKYGANLRLRYWDRAYLTTLIQQFPQLGYKYFSDDSRIRSKSRKTNEELYKENVQLNERLVATNTILEKERNARIRAQRDAVWKDISFAAAHRLGNPIFAIETNLDPLQKRIGEHKESEAVEIVNEIRTSIGKAKSIVEQFKSLTKAQEIRPKECRLKSILKTSCRLAKDSHVKLTIKCAEDVTIWGDEERLSEVFDELTANSLKWLNPVSGEISITVESPFEGPLPASVDSTKRYALIHFRDNGSGVQVDKKERIFDAFFTTDTQGTGLGLSLVRRVIEGHGGVIFESGTPNKGADFELYLPIAAGAVSTAPGAKGK